MEAVLKPRPIVRSRG